MGQNTTLYRRFVEEVLVTGNVDLVDEFVDAKFVEREQMPPGIPEGIEGVKAWISMWHTAFSDPQAEIEDICEDGDKVWARTTFRGTHTGDFLGIPATGKQVEFGGMDCVRIIDGKAVEHWGVTDVAAMLMQLGVLGQDS